MAILERFLSIKSATSKALIDIKEQEILANVELETLTAFAAGLKSLNIGLEKLCSRNAILVTAEGAFASIIGELNQHNSEIAKNMKWSKELVRIAILVYLD
ncbi:hypothetical protein AVEN_258016-1 [Araneus ventricosus]|uniref:Uncharacterized protein n=1 Tax=Araneus ventricosus TaxID=182803 RepID=A0A4Y2NUG0_ARAVE|nr:hypothetical protein AVEN_258016-1 [Araneus ventricosus]